jgi:hypothetical protein
LTLFFSTSSTFFKRFWQIFCGNIGELPAHFEFLKRLKRIKTKKMIINRDSDIVYFRDDNKNSLSYFNYKTGDYILDDELFGLFTKIYGHIHSTGGNFYQLVKSMGNVNKNNERYFIIDSEGKQQ